MASISNFKSSDIIVRTQGVYVGLPVEFLDLKNGLIYLRNLHPTQGQGEIFSINQKTYGYHWEYFQLPKGVPIDKLIIEPEKYKLCLKEEE